MQAHDPRVFVFLAGLVLLLSLLAVSIPVRRAIRVDPVEALRHE